jgi:hypothetical protein
MARDVAELSLCAVDAGEEDDGPLLFSASGETVSGQVVWCWAAVLGQGWAAHGLRCWAERPGKPGKFPSLFSLFKFCFIFLFSILLFEFNFEFCFVLQVLKYLNITTN